MNNIRRGKCKLCGKETYLTFEHVPPEKSFNQYPIQNYDAEDIRKLITSEGGRMPWDVADLHGKISQRGSGDYYLCQQCNNNTGSWYMNDYINFTDILHSAIQKEQLEVNNIYSITIKSQYPLRIFKAIMTMFCDINQDCFRDESLRNFLLEKDSTEFNSKKYNLYMYLSPQVSCKQIPLSIMVMRSNTTPYFFVQCSEITAYPVGFMLCINQPEQYKQEGVSINFFTNYGYNDIDDIELINIPCLETNTLVPGDYRSKESIKATIEKDRKEFPPDTKSFH